MHPLQERFDSLYMGDAARHVTMDHLEAQLSGLAPPPLQSGAVHMIVARGAHGLRHVLESASLSIREGLVGDSWNRSLDADPDAQLTAMEVGVAALVANGQSLAVYGDQLFLDLDLSSANLPVGSRVRVGEAVLEVSPRPHRGCAKFKARFGADALRFVSRPERVARNLRGLYFRVVGDGSVRVGDVASVLKR